MADFEAIVKKHIGEDGSIPATAIGTLVTDIKTTVGNEFVGKERYKAKLSEIDSMKNKLQDAEDNVQTAEGWKDKYNALKSEFDGYKVAETKKAEQAKKAEAYKALLKKAGVSDRRIDTVAKVASLDSITLDEGGNIVDADKLEASIKSEWADFIVTDGARGADTSTPPSNTGGNTKTKEDILAIKDTAERQKAIAENINLFR